ncbi:hypothetical protein F4703DRAFT_1820450 [Phycomyces blakesleeanus]
MRVCVCAVWVPFIVFPTYSLFLSPSLSIIFIYSYTHIIVYLYSIHLIYNVVTVSLLQACTAL